MFVEESKKVFANVYLLRFAVGWVKPYNIAFSIFPNVFNYFLLAVDKILTVDNFSLLLSLTFTLNSAKSLEKLFLKGTFA